MCNKIKTCVETGAGENMGIQAFYVIITVIDELIVYPAKRLRCSLISMPIFNAANVNDKLISIRYYFHAFIEFDWQYYFLRCAYASISYAIS